MPELPGEGAAGLSEQFRFLSLYYRASSPRLQGQATLEVKGMDFEIRLMEFQSQLCLFPTKRPWASDFTAQTSVMLSKTDTIIVLYPNVLRVFGSVPGS